MSTVKTTNFSVKTLRKNRLNCFVGALIFGDEILLGSVPMEDTDLVVIPKLLQLAVNPESPQIAGDTQNVPDKKREPLQLSFLLNILYYIILMQY